MLLVVEERGGWCGNKEPMSVCEAVPGIAASSRSAGTARCQGRSVRVRVGPSHIKRINLVRINESGLRTLAGGLSLEP